MLKNSSLKSFGQAFVIAWFGLLILPDVSAHGDMNWNDFTIDSKTDSIDASIQHAQKVMADIILTRRPITTWPDSELAGVRIELEHLQEEVEYMLTHFTDAGIRIQLTRELRANPRAGRAVTANIALETAIEMIEYIESLESHQAFEDELHEDGKAAYMYDLVEAYRDKLGVYQELIKALEAK